MIDLLLSLSLWALALVLNVWLIGFVLGRLWALRRWIVARLHIETDASLFFGAAVMQSAMVLMGWSLLSPQSAHGPGTRRCRTLCPGRRRRSRFSGVISAAIRNASAIRCARLRGYTKQIIEEAWPQQQQGQVPRIGVEWLNRFQAQLLPFEPSSESQKILHGVTLDAFNRLEDARRARLDSVNTALPGVMWFVLLPGAMGCLLLSLLFPIHDVRFQAILMTGLAGFVAMVLFVIVSLDRPFQGAMAISADSYQLIQDQLMN